MRNIAIYLKVKFEKVKNVISLIKQHITNLFSYKWVVILHFC